MMPVFLEWFVYVRYFKFVFVTVSREQLSILSQSSLSVDFSTSIHILLFNNPPSCASNYSRFHSVQLCQLVLRCCVCVCQVGWCWYTVFSAAPRCSPHTGWVIRSQAFPRSERKRGKWCLNSRLSQYYTFISILLSHHHHQHETLIQPHHSRTAADCDLCWMQRE